MPKTYTNPVYDYRRSPDQDARTPVHHPVIIVGAGPAGLAAALDFAIQGVPAVVLDDNDTVSVGSRAICFAKRTLEICDRYGCGERMLAKGVTWNLGKVFFRDHLVYEFNLLPEQHHKVPAFINLQQYYFEEYLVDRCDDFDQIDLRWRNKVTRITTDDTGASLEIDTPDGNYRLTCDYLLAADGANSDIRSMLGLESRGKVFRDRFLIADVVMQADFPSERWFWFDAPFHPGQSTLLHRQPDNVWRIDFQLGWDADPDQEVKPENVIPRVQAMLGDDVTFELEWTSIYTFRCHRMDSFIHHRVLFVGDATCQVSPFGARGANGAIQGVENLVWKIVRVLRGDAPPALLGTYDDERRVGARENVLNSSRSTDFITPKNHVSRVFRDATLELAEHYPFARSLVNSGRLSLPCHYDDSPLNSVERGRFAPALRPGSACRDAPIEHAGQHWLLNLLGNEFVVLIDAGVERTARPALASALQQLCRDWPRLGVVLIDGDPVGEHEFDWPADWIARDPTGVVRERYQLEPGTTYLIRPDQHVAARWRSFDAAALDRALRRALGRELE